MDIQYDFFDTGGIRLHYAAMGNPACPLILCLHGFPEYWAGWREIMVLILSLPG